jgi:outer membrane protein OmpA-like peptidoglycan-associated protein
MTNLNREKAALIASKEKLEKEKAELAGRLQSALSEVAETRDTARGFVVSLPDILFDLNKADLRHEAQLVISKLAGILLMMPELQIRTEGHTDSTGSMAYNQQLSESRAASVKALLISQGVTPDRVSSVGYGETKPIADNDSADGRKANRRVEVVIKDGKIE